MGEVSELLDRAIPDRTSTEGLSPVEAAEVDFLAGRPEAWTAHRSEVGPAIRARALVQARDPSGAREALAELVDHPTSPQSTAAATWAASRVGLGAAGAALRAQVDRLAPGFVVQDGVPLGTRELLQGLLAVAAGDLGAARHGLAAAVARGDERAPVWGARARLELARVLRTIAAAPSSADVGAASDAEAEARRALTSAGAFFAAGGYRHLQARVRAVSEAPPIHESSEPTLGHLVAGDRWQVGFGVQPWGWRAPRKGLVALRHLIDQRHRAVPAVELDAVVDGRAFDRSAIAHLDALTAGGPLEEEDLPAALRDLLLDDRARSRTSKLLRRTIAGLADEHPGLARHLDATVRTGYACRYEASAKTVWRI